MSHLGELSLATTGIAVLTEAYISLIDILQSCMQLLRALTVLRLMTEYQALVIYMQGFVTSSVIVEQ
jgi:hypothetical protein